MAKHCLLSVSGVNPFLWGGERWKGLYSSSADFSRRAEFFSLQPNISCKCFGLAANAGRKTFPLSRLLFTQ